MTTISKRYLGDGVYAEVDDEFILLTTNNGLETTNKIYLEKETLTNLFNYVNEIEFDWQE